MINTNIGNNRVRLDFAYDAGSNAQTISQFHSIANPLGAFIFRQGESTFAESLSIGMRIGWGGWRMASTGRVDPFLLGAWLPPLDFFVNAQLAIAHRQHGDCDKAISYADRALAHELGEGSETVRAGVEVEKGFAYLEREGVNRLKNALGAIKSFTRARELCVAKGGIRMLGLKAYTLSLLGDAHGYRALQEMGGVKDERHKKALPGLTNQLRIAARVARTAGMYEKLYDALFLVSRSVRA